MLSYAWGAAAALRILLYRCGWKSRHRLQRPVVSIGALGVGGTGKTPCVAALAQLLIADGKRPAILSRGYARRGRTATIVSQGQGLQVPVTEAGDEPAWFATALPSVPVAVAARREEAAELLLGRVDCDLFLLDDAFQHVRVHRDVDLVVVDATAPFWEDRPMPAGRLRERPAAASRADAFLLLGANGERAREHLKATHPGVPIFTLSLEPPIAIELALWKRTAGGHSLPAPVTSDILQGPAHAFAGIARPDRFFSSVKRSGTELLDCTTFPDHHWYHLTELKRLSDQAQQAGAVALLTTEKDAVRISHPGRLSLPIQVWRHRLRVDDANLSTWLAQWLAP